MCCFLTSLSHLENNTNQRHKCFHVSFALAPFYTLCLCMCVYESSTLGKTYKIKMWCYWQHFKEHIENFRNTLGIQLEHNRNTMGDRKKKSFHPPTQKTKIVLFGMHVEPFCWLHELYDLKLFVIIFGLG